MADFVLVYTVVDAVCFYLAATFYKPANTVRYTMPIRLILFTLLVLGATSQLACQPTTFRQCPNPHTDPTKRLYNDIVTELIERRFYNVYLPKQDQEVFQKHYLEVDHRVATIADSIWHQRQSARFQNKLFGDTARFQTFHLNTSPVRASVDLAELPGSFSALQPTSGIKALLTAFAPHQQQAALDSLNNVQSMMPAQEFRLCTSRLQGIIGEPNWKEWKDLDVNVLALSKVFFNVKQDQAMLSFGWRCGPKCGFGGVLLVEQVAGRWRIKQAIQTWIS